ncbi:MAG: glycine--tRNA ligase subunit beta [Acetobacteraceae bacterium]
MAELLLELLSEEIPAGLQERAAADLARLVAGALAPLLLEQVRTFHGPRRIALAAEIRETEVRRGIHERGPRTSAPAAALAGFLRKHGATEAEMRQVGGYWVLEREEPPLAAADWIAGALPDVLRRFPWTKSMRWGTSSFTWVRPLRRILCILDGEVVPFSLAAGEDDGHGLRSGNVTEGHRFHAPDSFVVASAAGWQDGLRERKVIVHADERRTRITDGIGRMAAKHGLPFDPGDDGGTLLDEVTGLAEWPVVLMGTIDERFMDLPPEVMRVTMRVNQRYFTFTGPDRRLARNFAFAANVEAEDGGAAIVSGNERVLAARLADARYFWDLDRSMTLEALLPKLEQVVFHAGLGSQGARVRRIAALAREIAPAAGAPPALAARAARLAKADLVSFMVGEFAELQGVMGGYYAEHDGEPESVARAIREHYAPKGPHDAVPTSPVSAAVALADKIDLISGFFAIGEKPTGSGDPFGLRRAALGIIRIVRASGLRLNLVPLIERWRGFASQQAGEDRAVGRESTAWELLPEQVLAFIVERLRVALRGEGARHDVLAAVFSAGQDDDIIRLLARADALAALLADREGADLLTLYRRAANILRIEERKDGPFHDRPEESSFRAPEERALADELTLVQRDAGALIAEERFAPALRRLARLRLSLDAFFERVTVNAPEPELRRNRLNLLSGVRKMIDRIADLSLVETREEEGRA